MVSGQSRRQHPTTSVLGVAGILAAIDQVIPTREFILMDEIVITLD